MLPRARADAIRRNWTPVDADHRNLRKLCIPDFNTANPGTRDPSFKIDRGQSLLLAEITLSGVVERRIRFGVLARSHDL
jgi:hypothetical protein